MMEGYFDQIVLVPLKDHKENFIQNIEFRLINPSNNKTGLEKIVIFIKA